MKLYLCSVRSLVVAALLIGTQLPANAQDMNMKLPKDPDVVTGKLDNGLTYYIRTNKKPAKKVELRLVVKAGSILENDDQQGLAHFMEHMNFNGTKHFQKNELVSYLQSIGVEFGADLNAYTAFDQTVYILPIPTDKPGNLEKGFQIIEDWAHNALLTDKDIDEERGVVLEESRLGKGAEDRMMQKYFPKLAEGSLYAQRLPIGKDDILKTFKYPTIRQYYADWYRPDLQAVIVVGDISIEQALKMIKEHFAGLKNPQNERERKYVDVQPRKEAEAMVVTDKEATNSMLIMTFPYEKVSPDATLGEYRQTLVKQLTEQMINRRLNDLAQGSNPPFPYAGVGTDDMIHGYESLTAYVLLNPESTDKAIAALTAELAKAKKFGFSESELELAKKQLQAGMEKNYNERTTTDSKEYVEEYIRAFLDGEPFPGVANEYKYYKELLPGVTTNDVFAQVNMWMGNMNTFTLITAPDKPDVKLPDQAALLAMSQKGFQQEVAKTLETKLPDALMTTRPTPGKVTNTVKDADLGTETYTLSNGVKVTIRPTDFKSDEILMTGVKKGGTGNYGIEDKSNVNFATDLVEAMGIGSYTPSDLEKIMAGKKIEVKLNVSDVTDGITASSTVKDFESMLQCLYLTLTAPRKDEALFTAFKEKQTAMLQFLTANPRMAFLDTTVKSMYNNNPLARMVFPKAADYDKLNLDRSLAIFRQEFGDADGFHFFIVGNVKKETALPLIEAYLGSLPAEGKTASAKDNGVRLLKGNAELKFYKGKEKQSMIMAVYSGDCAYSEDLSLKAQAVADVLNIKVIEELREKMGAIYGGGYLW